MFGRKNRIEIEPLLFERLEAKAEKDGYSSVDELVAHLLGNVIDCEKPAPSEEEKRLAEEQLRGLGYLK